MRPISILLDAYQPEHYKIETGSVRKVLGKDLGWTISIDNVKLQRLKKGSFYRTNT